jgi:hypothetical protein
MQRRKQAAAKRAKAEGETVVRDRNLSERLRKRVGPVVGQGRTKTPGHLANYKIQQIYDGGRARPYQKIRCWPIPIVDKSYILMAPEIAAERVVFWMMLDLGMMFQVPVECQGPHFRFQPNGHGQRGKAMAERGEPF